MIECKKESDRVKKKREIPSQVIREKKRAEKKLVSVKYQLHFDYTDTNLGSSWLKGLIGLYNDF